MAWPLAAVVVDDVHDDAQAVLVEGLDHLAELDGALGAVRVGGVGTLGDRVVVRVVAPVEGVLGGGLRHALLLLLGAGREGGEVAVGRRLLGLPLGDGGDVEGGQQVHVGGTGLGQLAQVPGAVALLVGEGEVGAPVVRVGGPVGDGEVADVQFLDLCVPQRYGLGLAVVLPAARGEGAVVQVDDEAALGVGGQGEGRGR